jgi:hypothetical protein
LHFGLRRRQQSPVSGASTKEAVKTIRVRECGSVSTTWSRHSGARIEDASYCAQLRIRESMVPQQCWDKWIPGLRRPAHPGMTAKLFDG